MRRKHEMRKKCFLKKNIPSISKTMVHVPEKFRKNTAMRFRVIVRKPFYK